MTRRQRFLWGAFGSVVPEVLRLFKLVAAGQNLPPLNWIAYGLLLALYVVCAGAFAIAWKPENEFKAIWVGCSLPALVATLAQTVPTLPHP